MHFCDYIASVIKRTVLVFDQDQIIKAVGPVDYDLDKFGAMKSTNKVIDVQDINGQKYRITVEAL
jgi:hypothetical protein